MQTNRTFGEAGLGALLDLSFTKFITLGVVKILYVLLIALAGLIWLVGVIAGFSQGFGPGLVAIILFTLSLAVQVIVWRVGLELVVVIFRIGENTSRLAGGDTGPTGGFPVTPYASTPPAV